jgi:hypothetical protein
MATQRIPSPTHPFVEPESGRITVPWFMFLSRLLTAGGGVAPGDGPYIIGAPDADLPNARVPTDSATIDFDFGTPGQLLAHVIGLPAGTCEPLTTGIVASPELIFALGDVITVCLP